MYRTHRDWANSVRKTMGLEPLKAPVSHDNSESKKNKKLKNENDILKSKIKYYEDQIRKQK